MVPVFKVIVLRTRVKVEGEPRLVNRYTSEVVQTGVVGEMMGTYYAILGQTIGKPDNDTHEKHYDDSMVPAAAAVHVGQ